MTKWLTEASSRRNQKWERQCPSEAPSLLVLPRQVEEVCAKKQGLGMLPEHAPGIVAGEHVHHGLGI